ncbi:hypothetical protein P7K49_013863 [Saguinus oedipus]|uniref:V-type proton ATPase subunit G n=1 Tax=Saguinus oedipus TaxID=9490 RepID=A0ABQ9VJA1_SAGOE|nr:hypothetical protein P7K49_013863 [Saguinus oedipus]
MVLPRNLLVWPPVSDPFNQMNGRICLLGAPVASLKGKPDQCILYGELLCRGAGKRAALAKTAVLAKTTTLATCGAPPPGNLLPRTFKNKKIKLRITAAMASQSQGIQQLLQAEKRAAEKVSEARKRKNQRLKQAQEAQAEIEQYRLQREKEFKAKEAAALGSHGSCSTEVEKETQEKMTILQTCFRQNRDEVFDNFLAFVCDVQPEIHENYCKNG